MFKFKQLLNEAGEGGDPGASKQPDLAKLLTDNFSKLEGTLKNLESRVARVETPAEKKQSKQVDEDDDLETLILSDPKKAVSKIKNQVKEEIMGSVSQQETVKVNFNNKFVALQNEFPEISDTSSDLHKRAKEIMSESANGQYDSVALELAVRRAAAEKGLQPMTYRKKSRDDDSDDGEYLGGGGSGYSGSQSNRKNRSDKLPAATLAFAELVGMDVKNPKTVERLTKTYQERKGNWSKYK